MPCAGPSLVKEVMNPKHSGSLCFMTNGFCSTGESLVIMRLEDVASIFLFKYQNNQIKQLCAHFTGEEALEE